MFGLPRGVGSNTDVPIASARWESPSEVSSLIHANPRALFLGALPCDDMWPRLSQLWEACHRARQEYDRVEDPRTRAQLVHELEGLWTRALSSEVLALGLDDDSHFITIAGTRSGKGASAIVPNLCGYPGSVVVIDPKGENASLTAAQRGHGLDASLGQEVFVLDPFNVTKVPDHYRGGFNPLEALDLSSDDIVDDAALLAEALIVPSGPQNLHWDESAKNFLKGLILYAKVVSRAADLFLVRELLVNGEVASWEEERAAKAGFEAECPSPFFHLIDRMRELDQSMDPAVQVELAKKDGLAAVIAATAFAWESAGTEERGSILSNARRNTAFLDSLGAAYKATLRSGARSFKPLDLKTAAKGVSVYLCLPAPRMQTHNRWMRVMISQILAELQRSQARPATGAPVLFVLDEFFTLGPMSIIENAAGFAAGYGIKLWAVLQDLQQLKAMYPSSWETFIANAGALQVFGVSDTATCEYVSKAAGRTAVWLTSQSVSASSQTSGSRRSAYQRAAPLVGLLAGRRFLQASLEAIAAINLDDTSTSTSRQQQDSSSKQVKDIPLIQPDEVSRLFSAASGTGVLLIKGRLPIWYVRISYFDSPWFAGQFTPIARYATQNEAPPSIPLGGRNAGAFDAILAAYLAASRASS